MPDFRNILLIFKPSGEEKGVPIQQRGAAGGGRNRLREVERPTQGLR